MEARGFRRALPELLEFGVTPIGASRDRATAQARFASREGLEFPMLCDTEGRLTQAFGVRSLVGLAKRVTFFVDAEGIVRQIWDSVSAAGHADAALEGVRRWASERDSS